ncbi:MAG: ABC transporter ATP-binding protein [Dehalococcoidia bacterium]|nr:ABC transporter ATP-binding protein [Dehalococcoidia bacterium]
MSLIEAKALGLTKARRPVLQDINLAVMSGEVLALIGPTGSGKTSLLRLLGLLDYPTAGEVTIDGHHTLGRRERLQLRQGMAFVQQKPIAFRMSVADNVSLGLRFRHLKYHPEESHSLLALVGLAGYERRDARTLSGGETQRLALARALITKPSILFLDEPTANLDPVSSEKVEEVLAHIAQQGNLTILLATHDMVQGQRLAGRIAVMMNGRLLQVGRPQEIFAAPQSHEVAEFVGVGNIWSGVVAAQQEGLMDIRIGSRIIQAVGNFSVGQAVDAFLRPEEISLSTHRDESSMRNVFRGVVRRLTWLGALTRVEVDCGFTALVLVTRRSAEELSLQEGQELYANFKASSIHVNSRAL